MRKCVIIIYICIFIYIAIFDALLIPFCTDSKGNRNVVLGIS